MVKATKPTAETRTKRAGGRKLSDSKPAASASQPGQSPTGSGILITQVRVRNYRCLRFVDVELNPLTVLIGENNSGKTSFLNALSAAIGATQRAISSDDVFLQKVDIAAPKDRAISIDILVRPTDEKGNFIDVFPQGSPWLELWGLGVVQDDEGRI